MKTIAFFLATLVPAIASAQGKPTTGYAPVNGLKMYYEVYGSGGTPLVLIHGAFSAIGTSSLECTDRAESATRAPPPDPG